MKAANSWITYRTRFLVKAKQLTSNLTFTDSLNRLHSGRKGDYLVKSCEGVLSIASRQIFEDIYVPLLPPSEKARQKQESPEALARTLPLHLTRQPYRGHNNLSPRLRSL